MPEKFHYIIPAVPPAADIFATYQLTYDFYREAKHREDLKDYCEWYRRTAESNRQELQKMRREPNIFGWFNRRQY